jgi:cobyrinic acid a,c-diamide synthase
MTRGFLIAAPKSGSGKTTLSLGLMRALTRKGMAVRGAKCGPDYIDPAFHGAATGRPSFNLDTWAMPPALLHGLARDSTLQSEMLIAEASMGLFDGVPAEAGRSGASADVAAALGLPVLLVLDVTGQAQSAAAIVKGCMTYDPRITIAGLILNRVGSSRHMRLAGGAIEALGVPVIGSLPKSDAVVLPERHLGLVQAGETADLDARLDSMADFIEAHVDLDKVLALAQPLDFDTVPQMAMHPPGQRIALAQDAAFSFIYPHLLHGWRAMGAEILPFSPLANQGPDMNADVCWLPGGYPELHAGTLAAADRFRDQLTDFAKAKPVHGECGGYMALGESLTDAQGHIHRMAGLLGVSTSFAKRKMQLGYRDATLCAAGAVGQKGMRFRGHEFHYASILSLGDDAPFAQVVDAYDSAPAPSGSQRGHVTGSFFHVIAGVP